MGGFRIRLCLAALAAMTASIAFADPTIIYVNQAARPGGNGTSWAAAFKDLQLALAASDSLPKPVEIWVAGGKYKPAPTPAGSNNEISFELRSEVSIIGHFGGFEAAPDERDLTDPLAVTVLSGDLDNNDTQTLVVGTNSKTVLSASGVTGSLLEDCKISGGMNSTEPSALSVIGSDIVLLRVVFQNNAGKSGVCIGSTDSDIEARHTWFVGNMKTAGSPIFLQSSGAASHWTFDHCVCANNSSTGGPTTIVELTSGAAAEFNSCTFAGNVGSTGISASGSTVSLRNSVIWGSSSSVSGFNSDDTISYCLLQGSAPVGPVISNSIFNVNPLFIDLDGPDNILGTPDDDVSLAAGSPCIDRGSNALLLLDDFDLDADGITDEWTPRDIKDRIRRFDDIGTTDGGEGNAPIVDIGAAEFVGITAPGTQVVWINPVGGNYSQALNWSPMSPSAQNSAHFVIDESYLVNVDGDFAAKQLLFHRGDVSLVGGELDLDSSDGLIVGDEQGDNAIATLSAGIINAGDTLIGHDPGAIGHLVLDNAAILSTDEIRVGDDGFGALTVLGGSKVTDTFTCGVGLGDGSGILTLSEAGSSLNATILYVGDGLVQINSGAELKTAIAAVTRNGIITGDGTFSGLVFSSGTIKPAAGCCPLTINGSYSQVDVSPDSTGSLAPEFLIDEDSTSIGQLVVNGEATLAGGLFVVPEEPISILNPPYDILTADTITDQFDVALLPAIPGKIMRVNYGPASGVAGGGGLAGGGEAVSLSVESLSSALGFDGPSSVDVNGSPAAAAVGHLDNDPENRLDLAIALPDSANPEASPGQVLVLHNLQLVDGQLTYDEPAIAFAVGVNPLSVEIADLDGGDGPADIAVANAGDDDVSVLFNDGSGETFARVDVPVGTQPMAVKAASFIPASGRQLAVANASAGTVSIVDANGQVLTVIQTLIAGAVPCSVEPVDIDSDGLIDLVVTNHADDTIALYFNGGGGFDPAVFLASGIGPIDVQADDLDGDQQPEIVTSNSGDATVSVYVNKGGGDFAPAVNLPVNADSLLAGSMVLVDLDEDDDPEIALVATDEDLGPVVKVLRNDTDGGSQLTLADAENLETGGRPLLVLAGDLDLDTDDDLITVNAPASGGGGVAGDGPPSPFVAALPNTALGLNLCLADLNGDGLVNGADLGLLLAAWNTTDPIPDLDGSGAVDGADLGLLLATWRDCP